MVVALMAPVSGGRTDPGRVVGPGTTGPGTSGRRRPSWEGELMNEQIEPRSIVVAVDGSEHADRALRWAAEQAALEHRPLAVVAVGDDSGAMTEEGVATARRLHPGLEPRALALTGDPREVLLDLSERAGLLVLGSRGR